MIRRRALLGLPAVFLAACTQKPGEEPREQKRPMTAEERDRLLGEGRQNTVFSGRGVTLLTSKLPLPKDLPAPPPELGQASRNVFEQRAYRLWARYQDTREALVEVSTVERTVLDAYVRLQAQLYVLTAFPELIMAPEAFQEARVREAALTQVSIFVDLSVGEAVELHALQSKFNDRRWVSLGAQTSLSDQQRQELQGRGRLHELTALKSKGLLLDPEGDELRGLSARYRVTK